jgi:hypothetical protein
MGNQTWWNETEEGKRITQLVNDWNAKNPNLNIQYALNLREPTKRPPLEIHYNGASKINNPEKLLHALKEAIKLVNQVA